MQDAPSKEYAAAMKLPFRNRAYVRASIGVINSDAQNGAWLDSSDAGYVYFMNTTTAMMNKSTPSRFYATAEQDFSKVDGSMYFLPHEGDGYSYRNNGIIPRDIVGDEKDYVKIIFYDSPTSSSKSELTDLDIYGLTINFGEYYPTEFTVETDSGTQTFENDSQLFTTETTFTGVSYFIIKPTAMVNGQGRMRILMINFGISNYFTGDDIIECTVKDTCSPISEDLPSLDISLKVDNQDLYYRPDNPESPIAFMETGQEVKIAFGYDVSGDGDIEWLDDTCGYLSTWSADDTTATFAATDRYVQLTGTYYGGLYSGAGQSLYDLAVVVLADAGFDSGEYVIDKYLQQVTVKNPLPPQTHAECLQLIANAGRCILRADRSGKIYIKATFSPELTVTADDMSEYGSLDGLVTVASKKAYANASQNFSVVDGSLLFAPESGSSVVDGLGFVSESVYVDGAWSTTIPTITIKPSYTCDFYGLSISFRNVAPAKISIIVLTDASATKSLTVEDPGLQYTTTEEFLDVTQLVISIDEGPEDSRVFIDSIILGDVTDYTLTRTSDLTESPACTADERIKEISVKRTTYSKSTEEAKQLASEDVTLTEDSYVTIHLSQPSYGFTASASDSSISVDIASWTAYAVKIGLSGITSEVTFTVTVTGYEYVATERYTTVSHNTYGQTITWSNPLISTEEHAQEVEAWLAEYYCGNLDYDISWRGDPRFEANDLFYLDLKNMDPALCRCYENSLSFDGAWSGTMKARKAAVSWQS